MKKLYLLAFMAATTLSLSAQTWIQTQLQAEKQAVPMTQTQNNLKANASGSLLRAVDTRSLPDSVYSSNSIDEYNKTYYKYTEEGWVSEELWYQWDSMTNSYILYGNQYEYDEYGYVIRRDSRTYNGMETTTTYKNTYDEQGRLSSAYSITEETNTHSITEYEYDGNNYTITNCDSTFNADGTLANLSRYKTGNHYDDAGNHTAWITYGIAGSDNDGNPIWYEANVYEFEYDTQNRQIASTSTSYDAVGNRTYEYESETTYLDDGDSNYIHVSHYRYLNPFTNEWGEMFEDRYKYENKGENPVITYRSLPDENGEWLEPQILTITFYPGPLTANETIKADMPALKAYAANGTLFINLNGTAPVQVYSVNGTCHYNATASGNIAIANLPAGIYIVKAGDETVKISVR